MKEKEKRIIVVDDEIDIANIFTMALQDAGYQVRTCYDSREVLKAVREYQPRIILLDVMMPNQTGDEVLDEIDKDEEIKGIPVIFATAADPKTRAELEERYAGRPFTGFLGKPPKDLDDIPTAVGNMLRAVESPQLPPFYSPNSGPGLFFQV